MSVSVRYGGRRRWPSRRVVTTAVLLPLVFAVGCRGDVPSAVPDAVGTPRASQAEALATLTAAAAGAPAASPLAGVAGAIPQESVAEGPAAVSTVSAAQATANAELGIADVSALVDRMEPLATFTPSRGDPDVSGRLLYVRSGRFYVAEAGGGPGARFGGDGLPAVWAPPDDPGRAWPAPDGKHVAFFAGADAELWIMAPGDETARKVSGPNLPTDAHTVTVLGREQQVTIRPGIDYTFVLLPGAEQPLAVVTDDNSRHIRGEARIRVVHAAGIYRDTPLRVYNDGAELAGPIAFGASGGDQRVFAGAVRLTIGDDAGRRLADLPEFTAADKELRTVFLFGDDELQAAQFAYDPSLPPSGSSRVRVFNAGGAPLDVVLDDDLPLATGLAPGALGDYATVPTVLGVDARGDAELGIYGLRQGEDPLAWSPDGTRVAFVGYGDGQPDVYVAGPGTPAERVTRTPEREANPLWSLDGRSLAWEVIDETVGGSDLVVLPPGAAQPRPIDLLPIVRTMGWPASIRVKLPRGVDWVDGSRLALYPQSEATSGGIWLYDVAVDRTAQLFDSAITDVDYSSAARAFVVALKDRPGELVVVDLAGEHRTLATGSAYGGLWSPDGKLVSWVEGDATSATGWRIHVVRGDGTDDRTLTDWWPILQSEPPVPGPRAKRTWLDDGRRLAFTRAGRDYGAAERAGTLGAGRAGNDIENVWIVPTDGSAPPKLATDLTRVFYLRSPELSPDGDTFSLVGFSYLDRSQQLWVVPAGGGKPAKVDGGVRWSMWLP